MLHQIASSRDAAGRKTRFSARVLPALLVFGAAAVTQSAGIANAASPTPSSYGLYNTGFSAGAMLGMEAADPDYTVAYEGTASPTDPGTPLTSSTMYVTATTNASGQPYLPWQPADNGTSAFISPYPTYAAGQSNQGGLYDVSTTFTIAAGDFASVALFGRFESDDAIQNIFVNGVATGITQPPEGYLAFLRLLQPVQLPPAGLEHHQIPTLQLHHGHEHGPGCPAHRIFRGSRAFGLGRGRQSARPRVARPLAGPPPGGRPPSESGSFLNGRQGVGSPWLGQSTRGSVC